MNITTVVMLPDVIAKLYSKLRDATNTCRPSVALAALLNLKITQFTYHNIKKQHTGLFKYEPC